MVTQARDEAGKAAGVSGRALDHEARNRRIFERWLACWTLDEIAESEGIGVKTADDAIAAETAGLPKPQQSLADQALARRHN